MNELPPALLLQILLVRIELSVQLVEILGFVPFSFELLPVDVASAAHGLLELLLGSHEHLVGSGEQVS